MCETDFFFIPLYPRLSLHVSCTCSLQCFDIVLCSVYLVNIRCSLNQLMVIYCTIICIHQIWNISVYICRFTECLQLIMLLYGYWLVVITFLIIQILGNIYKTSFLYLIAYSKKISMKKSVYFYAYCIEPCFFYIIYKILISIT